jgi:hypothetical protein
MIIKLWIEIYMKIEKENIFATVTYLMMPNQLIDIFKFIK